MTTITAPEFRKVQSGLYGTGITRSINDRGDYLHTCDCETVEAMIDRHSLAGCWQVRYVCEHLRFTDATGECYETLRAARAHIARLVANGEADTI